jgi:hypothetical protein
MSAALDLAPGQQSQLRAILTPLGHERGAGLQGMLFVDSL